ncbi:membrane dipeptidase [Altererythrobacter sp. CC-YST694]|uniref:dipeptidase n=1 Tax=Altererythrobacter sp. CC-YST694 TaxID=2755038 RepID=UPI001D0089BE|nr:dipeptidase [Altererythrobacter sp. CC-YST694]MCB5426109.1 membrane dipeptidase [Altererythrobacter sp. CC-YST694]
MPRFRAALLVTALCATALATPLAAKSPEETAAAALAAAPVWDGHNDVPEQLRGRYGNMINQFDFTDTSKAPPTDWSGVGMHTDLPRLRKGKVGAQFWSVYVDADLPQAEAVVVTLEQIDVLKRLVARYPNDMMLATSSADVEVALKQGKIASLMGMEGGSSIDGSLGVLRQMYDLGARYLTLTHSKTLEWADSATDEPKHGGLTDFGKDVVREMQRIGMLVDLSHVSEDTMFDALDVAKAPVIFSHSGARGINGHARNVPDGVLSRLKANGGIVMVVGLPGYLGEKRRQWGADRVGEEARLKSLWLGEPAQVKEGMDAWMKAHPEPKVTIADMADHIDHVRDVAGIDHIGLGGDYDGMDSGPVGMEDVTGYPALFTELARRGYSQADLEKIASRNMMRVLKAAEAYAAAHRADPPIEYPEKG